ncbi:MAG: hypothetical protein CFH16_00331 [Alphaproteobacteria bacterium MarineAlpha5_Bin6]|mgnify:CR=1 FL=1|nr:MAG: hypothetical protein CFH16_00331 [Alphaproteobacteria bacterium MarineAlpha5_Bin6]
MKALIIGLGSIGLRHRRILKKIKKISQIKFFSKHKYNDKNNLKSRKEILKYNPDYIVICSATHEHITDLKFLEKNFKNKMILIEKPLFHKYINYNVKNNKVFVGYNLRYHPLIQFIKEICGRKKIWSINILCGSYLPEWRKNVNYKNSYSAKQNSGGVLLDLSHELDYISYLFGNWKPLFAVSKKISNLDIKSDDYLSLFATNNNNLKIYLELNYFTRIPKRQIFIDSKNLSLKIDLLKNEAIIIKDKIISKKIKKFKIDEMYEAQHIDIINKKFKFACNYNDGIKIMKKIDKIRDLKH